MPCYMSGKTSPWLCSCLASFMCCSVTKSCTVHSYQWLMFAGVNMKLLTSPSTPDGTQLLSHVYLLWVVCFEHSAGGHLRASSWGTDPEVDGLGKSLCKSSAFVILMVFQQKASMYVSTLLPDLSPLLRPTPASHHPHDLALPLVCLRSSWTTCSVLL